MKTALEIKALIAAEKDALQAGQEVSARNYFLIVESKLPELEAKLDKLIKRANKLGVTPISYTVGADWIDEEYTRSDDGVKRTYHVRFRPVHIEGEHPVLNGWIFAGTIQHLDGENIVKNILADVPAPMAYQTASRLCDHCQTNRKRTDTYMVYHSATKAWKQIGHNCLVDFLGSTEANDMARCAEFYYEALAQAGEGEGGGERSIKPRYSLGEVLALSAGAIEQFGWLSRSKARELNNDY